MPKIKVHHVVTFSSEDNAHVASNILTTDMTKKWKTKGTGEVSANVVVQLDRATKISGVDICNECSAFVEVLVGRSSSPREEYQPLVIMSSFMSPMESRELKETNRVRIFSHKELVPDIRDEKWDRVKFNCTQPFNKNIQYGLSNVTLYSPQEEVKEELKPVSLGKFKLRPESPDDLSPGSLFTKRNDSHKKESLSEQIKKITTKEYFDKNDSPKATTPKVAPKNHPTHNTTPNNKPSTSKNRNSIDLFYEPDDDKHTDKIDRLMAHRKEQEKESSQKKETEQLDKQKKNTPSSSSKKRNHDKVDKVEKTPKKKEKHTEIKQKDNGEPKVKKQCLKKPVVRKPFGQLFNGVVFTISGIVNPERASLREKALEMGARYKPNWDNYCTHLICAFANTPKFREVQGKGKIVTKDWVQDCYEDRKRLPWRRYALDDNDQGKPESEDEIIEEQSSHSENLSEEETPSSPLLKIENSGSDTEDEVERILAQQKQKENQKHKKEEKKEGIVKNQTNDPFDADTDEEKLERSEKPMNGNNLPKIFDKDMFYVDDIFDEHVKKDLEKLITIINGYVLDKPRTVADYIVTLEETAKDIKDRYSETKIVSPDWIYEMYNNQKLVPVDKYILA